MFDKLRDLYNYYNSEEYKQTQFVKPSTNDLQKMWGLYLLHKKVFEEEEK